MKSEADSEKIDFKRHEYTIPFDDSVSNKNNFEIIRYLKENTILFKEVSDDLIIQLVPLSLVEKYQKGDEILKEHSINKKVFFLMDGTIGVYKEGDHVLSLKRRGDVFGEMSLISRKPCSATVIAETDVSAFSIRIRDIGEQTTIIDNTLKDILYKLYAVILADKLAMTTEQAIGLEKKVNERTKDLKINNENLRLAKIKAEEANQAKNEFLSNMSHELRTPMHQILSFAHIGMKKFNSEKDKTIESFKNIIFSSNRMMGFINNLLDLSKLQNGGIEYLFVKNDFLTIIKNNVISLTPELEKRHISVKIAPPGFSTKLICDSQTISQAFRNILSNAIKFTKENKTISISLDLQSSSTLEESAKDCLLVSVKDEGPGIPGNELEFIFDRFTQSSKTKTGAGGTGLGLAICKEIIKSHNGKTWAENNPEGGAVFRILLPFEQSSK